ncbi:MAG TPA: ABC transporter ATP-binding protein [Sandaracinaceae bacterium LLY-WYZ-13_1]|nr:ABC transporter ATP-binding protein [Sandaracinaceae bacterium LLY-WYZ-13_1]
MSETALLSVRGLAKRYGRVRALRGLDLTVGAGEVYGFLGRNGAGKSTTIRILMGITKPDAGEVRLFGEPTKGAHVRVRQRIGYVAQEQTFYDWMTAKRLARFVSRFYPTWDQSTFERLCAAQAVPLDRKVGTFSGGMRVKLALALALGPRPPLLILDEPTAGLDPVARREFLERVREDAERTGRTTFFSTHLIDEVELVADRVGIVDDGRTRYEGTVDALAARVRLFAGEPPPDLALPEGVRPVSDRTFRGRRRLVFEAPDPTAFAALEARLGAPLSRLPLEEIFIEMVRREPTGV